MKETKIDPKNPPKVGGKDTLSSSGPRGGGGKEITRKVTGTFLFQSPYPIN